MGKEALRLLKASHEAKLAGTPIDLHGSVVMSLLGMVFAFLAGLVALKWLSSWLEAGPLVSLRHLLPGGSVVVFYLHHIGY